MFNSARGPKTPHNDVQFILSAFCRMPRSLLPTPRTALGTPICLGFTALPLTQRRGSRQEMMLIYRRKHSASSLACLADTAPALRDEEVLAALSPMVPSLSLADSGEFQLGACQSRRSKMPNHRTWCMSTPYCCANVSPWSSFQYTLGHPQEPGFTEGRQGGLHGSIRSAVPSFHIGPMDSPADYYPQHKGGAWPSCIEHCSAMLRRTCPLGLSLSSPWRTAVDSGREVPSALLTGSLRVWFFLDIHGRQPSRSSTMNARLSLLPSAAAITTSDPGTGDLSRWS